MEGRTKEDYEDWMLQTGRSNGIEPEQLLFGFMLAACVIGCVAGLVNGFGAMLGWWSL